MTYIIKTNGDIINKKIDSNSAENESVDLDSIAKTINDNNSEKAFTYKNNINADDPYTYKITSPEVPELKSQIKFLENKLLQPKYKNSENFGEEETSRKSYGQLYSFLESRDIFAQEFEILTGHRFVDYTSSGTNNLKGIDFLKFFADFFGSIVADLFMVEVIVGLNRIPDYNNKVDNSRRINIKLGNYVYTEYDVFSRYINKVLNYKDDNDLDKDIPSRIGLRLIYFLVGFINWFDLNNTIDFDEIIKTATKNEKSGRDEFYKGIKESIPFGGGETLMILLLIAEKAVLALLSDNSLKRMITLSKKFYNQDIWHRDNIKEKDTSMSSNFFVEKTNYYRFKFIIERMNVGKNLVSKKYEDKFNKNKYFYNGLKLDHDDYPITSSNRNLKISLYDYNHKKFDVENAFKNINVSLGESLFSLQQNIYKGFDGNNKNKIDPTGQEKEVEHIKNNEYLFNNNKNNKYSHRLSIEDLNILEGMFEHNSYIPFYFHDMRTNEAVNFHAFIDNLSDSFNPEYSTTSGYGRIDDVKTYVKTTRNINLSFTVASMSREEHTLMWRLINRLILMVYPQWSTGEQFEKNKQIKPFSQTITASPLIRLRVGDIIKSNFSFDNFRDNMMGLSKVSKEESDKHQGDGPVDRSTGTDTIVKNNPVYKSFMSSMSKGLAGHITQIDLNYNESTWEIDYNNQAPIFAKITLSFAPIHDIPPGINSNGVDFNNIYRIGYFNNNVR